MLTKPLRRVFQAVAIAIPLISFGTQSALSADPRDFTLVNRGSSPILYVYISDTGLTTWGPDILGRSEVLPPGESTEIVFPGAEPDRCRYDIKVTNEGGDGVIRDIDLCATRTVTFE